MEPTNNIIARVEGIIGNVQVRDFATMPDGRKVAKVVTRDDLILWVDTQMVAIMEV